MSATPPSLPPMPMRPVQRMNGARKAGIVLIIMGAMTTLIGVSGVLIATVGPFEEMMAEAARTAPMYPGAPQNQSRSAFVFSGTVLAMVGAAMLIAGVLLLREGKKWRRAGLILTAVCGGYMLVSFLGALALGAVPLALVALIPTLAFLMAFNWLRQSKGEEPTFVLVPPPRAPMAPQSPMSPWQPGYGAPMAGYYWKPPADTAPGFMTEK